MLDYTIGQLRAFVASIGRADRARAVRDAVSARMAQADGKAWKKYIASLDR